MVIPTLPPSILEEHFVLILAIVIPGVVLIVSFLFMLVVCCCVCHHKKNRKSLKLENKVSSHDSEERYVTNNRPPSPGSVTDYYLLPDRKRKRCRHSILRIPRAQLSGLYRPVSQRKTNVLVSESVDVKVRAKSIKTPDVFFANPSAEEALKDEKFKWRQWIPILTKWFICQPPAKISTPPIPTAVPTTILWHRRAGLPLLPLLLTACSHPPQPRPHSPLTVQRSRSTRA